MQKLKNNEAQLKFTGSYKKKKRVVSLSSLLAFIFTEQQAPQRGRGPARRRGGVGDLQTLVATN